MSLGLQACGVDTWLGVVPQLIARVHAASPRVTKLLRELLVRIGRKHPQVSLGGGDKTKQIGPSTIKIDHLDLRKYLVPGMSL